MRLSIPSICIFGLSKEEFPEGIRGVVEWVERKHSAPDSRYHFRKNTPTKLVPGSIVIFSIEGKLIGQGSVKRGIRPTPTALRRELKHTSGHDYPHYLGFESSSLRIYKKFPKIASVKIRTKLKFARLFTYLDNIGQYRIILRMADATSTEREVINNSRRISNERKRAIVRKYGPSGEGNDHKRLKEWISKHPEFIGMKGDVRTEIEYEFPSGDKADIVFELPRGRYAVIEVETDNPLPGGYQALKYKVLFCAEQNLPITSRKVEAILVAWVIPQDVRKLCGEYGIRYIEKRI